MDDLKGHGALHYCSECGKRFERNVALISHAKHCQKKATAPPGLARSLKRKALTPIKVVEEKKTKYTHEEMMIRVRSMNARVVLEKTEFPLVMNTTKDKSDDSLKENVRHSPKSEDEINSFVETYRRNNGNIDLQPTIFVDILEKMHRKVNDPDSINLSEDELPKTDARGPVSLSRNDTLHDYEISSQKDGNASRDTFQEELSESSIETDNEENVEEIDNEDNVEDETDTEEHVEETKQSSRDDTSDEENSTHEDSETEEYSSHDERSNGNSSSTESDNEANLFEEHSSVVKVFGDKTKPSSLSSRKKLTKCTDMGNILDVDKRGKSHEVLTNNSSSPLELLNCDSENESCSGAEIESSLKFTKFSEEGNSSLGNVLSHLQDDDSSSERFFFGFEPIQSYANMRCDPWKLILSSVSRTRRKLTLNNCESVPSQCSNEFPESPEESESSKFNSFETDCLEDISEECASQNENGMNHDLLSNRCEVDDFGVAKKVLLFNDSNVVCISDTSNSEVFEGSFNSLDSKHDRSGENTRYFVNVNGESASTDDGRGSTTSQQIEDDEDLFLDGNDWVSKKIGSLMNSRKKKCLLCMKTFSRITLLRQHIACHFNINKYKCLVNSCNFQSFLRVDMNNHLMKVHKKKDLEPHFERLYPKKEDFDNTSYIPDSSVVYSNGYQHKRVGKISAASPEPDSETSITDEESLDSL